MKFAVGLVIAFLLGVGTSYFDLPAPAPPKIKGALLILAITIGYIAGDNYLESEENASTNGTGAEVTDKATPEPASE